MVASFVLFLREGLECSLLVSIIFAALRQLGQERQIRAVWIGVVLAVLGSLLGGLAIFMTIHYYDGSMFESIFETSAFLLAVVLLTGMTFWMQKNSRTLHRDITSKAASATSGFAMGLLAFTAVGREGLETAFFTMAFAFQTNGLMLLIGALFGLIAAIGLSYMIYRMGYRLNYRIFFRIMGLILLIFAAGLLSNAVSNLQELNVLPFGTAAIWNTTALLSQESYIGDLLHSLLGYSDTPSQLQAVFYTLYLLVFGGAFVWLTRKPGGNQPAAARESSSGTLTSRA